MIFFAIGCHFFKTSLYTFKWSRLFGIAYCCLLNNHHLLVLKITSEILFEGTGKLEHIKLKVKKSGPVGVWTPDLSLSGQVYYHWTTQVHMVDSEQTRLVKIYHSHGRLKRPTVYNIYNEEMAYMLHLNKA